MAEKQRLSDEEMQRVAYLAGRTMKPRYVAAFYRWIFDFLDEQDGKAREASDGAPKQ